MIKPILLYGSEIWAMDLIRKNFNKLKDIDSQPFEQLHVKICKLILGVKRNTSNVAVKAELGRFPLFRDVLQIMLKYWIRLLKLDDSRLVKKAYLTELKNDNKKWTWSQSVKKTTRTL